MNSVCESKESAGLRVVKGVMLRSRYLRRIIFLELISYSVVYQLPVAVVTSDIYIFVGILLTSR